MPSVLGAMLLGATAAAQSPAVTKEGGAAAERTTRAGVYTAAQATRGAEVYLVTCKSCHTPASHTGTTFAKGWHGRTLSDLYGYVSTQMPKNDPGGLPPEQYADVIAYLLRLNAMPAGAAELPIDSAALAPIRIDVRRPAAKRAVTTTGKAARRP